MDAELLRLAVQFLHVSAAILWIGGGFYTLLVQLPALMAAPAGARGPVMAQLGPRQVSYILRVAELTIATGFAQILVSGRTQQLAEPLQSRWGLAILAGLVLAIVLYALIRGVFKPGIERVLALGPKAAAGDPAAPAEIAAILERVRRVGQVQVVIGLVIIFVMVLARFS